MSAQNGDKAHFHIRRKAKIRRRVLMREMEAALQGKAPKAAPSPARASGRSSVKRTPK